MPDSEISDGRVTGFPLALLRLEGLAVFAATIVFYSNLNESWLLFVLLFFVPDTFMIGYVANNRIGAAIYNIGHTYVLPLFLLALSWNMSWPRIMAVAVIWIAHIGFDRVIGYGLKYPSGFKQTHLSGHGQ